MRSMIVLASFVLLAAAPPNALTEAGVLAKAKAAAGTLDPQATFHIEETTNDGARTVQTMRDEHGAEYVQVNIAGGIVTDSGRFKGQEWRQDANGTLFFLSPSRKGHLETADRTRIASRDANGDYTIVFDDGDATTTNTYDQSTFLLKAKETKKHGSSIRYVYSDYRDVGGAKRAFHVAWSSSSGSSSGTIEIEKFQEVTAEQAPIGLPPAPPAFETAARVPFDLHARFIGTKIIVPVTIDGHTIDCYLDSGDATGMTLDPEAARQLGLTVVNRRIAEEGGRFESGDVIASDVKIGEATAKNLVFSIAPVMSDLPYTKIEGLVGVDFFASNILQIDYGAKRVTVIPHAAFVASSLGSTAEPARMQDGAVHTRAWFNGQAADVMLDTGAPMSFLSEDMGSKVGVTPADCFNDRLYRAPFIGGSVKVKTCDVKNIVIGGNEYRKGRVAIAAENTAAANGIDGIVGYDILSDYIVTFDYQDGAVYFKLTP